MSGASGQRPEAVCAPAPSPVWALPAAYDRPPAGGEAARRVALALRPPAAAGGPTGLHDALVNGGLHAYCSRAQVTTTARPASWLAGRPLAVVRGHDAYAPTTRTRTRRGGACRGWTGLIRARWRRRGRNMWPGRRPVRMVMCIFFLRLCRAIHDEVLMCA